MSAERRQQERFSFCMEECKGTFLVQLTDEEFEVDDVTDISLSGIGIDISTFVDPDTEVTIRYEEDDNVISVSGKVMWCDDHPSVHSCYQVGILFNYSHDDANSQLLLAVRDYLDTSSEDSPDADLEFDETAY